MQNNKNTTILIVDGDIVFNHLLKNSLKKYKYLIIQAFNGEEALAALDKQKIDLILLETRLTAVAGYEVIKVIRKKQNKHDLPIIILSCNGNVEHIVEGFFLGANDYLVKPVDFQVILNRIMVHLLLSRLMNTKYSDNSRIHSSSVPLSIHEGNVFPAIHQAGKTVNESIPAVSPFHLYKISEREKEIILSAIQGKINKEIAGELNISEGTVRRHLENIYRKCRIQNRTELAALFLINKKM